ncbi:hypothetical protein J7M28_01245 [bacterium]|nr:hypothetical protein [bacterium]
MDLSSQASMKLLGGVCKSSALVIFAAALILCAGTSASCLADDDFDGIKVDFEQVATPSLMAFFTGNTYGTMTRSSCSDPQLGGFERRRAFILQCLPDADELLLVDAGNLFAANCERERVKAHYIIAAFNMMAYDAVALGPTDFVFGLDFLKTLAGKAKFPFICANLVDSTTQEPIFDTVFYPETTAATVCVTGVISMRHEDFIVDCTTDEAGERPVELIDPLDALAANFPATESTTNVIIVMAQMAFDEAMMAVDRFPEIDLLVISDRGRHDDLVRGSTYITDVGTKGKFFKGAALLPYDESPDLRFHVETFPIVEEIEHSYSMRRLYERFLSGRKSLLPERLVQEPFIIDRRVYHDPEIHY